MLKMAFMYHDLQEKSDSHLQNEHEWDPEEEPISARIDSFTKEDKKKVKKNEETENNKELLENLTDFRQLTKLQSSFLNTIYKKTFQEFKMKRDSFFNDVMEVKPIKIQSKEIIAQTDAEEVDDKVIKLRKYVLTEEKIKKEIELKKNKNKGRGKQVVAYQRADTQKPEETINIFEKWPLKNVTFDQKGNAINIKVPRTMRPQYQLTSYHFPQSNSPEQNRKKSQNQQESVNEGKDRDYADDDLPSLINKGGKQNHFHEGLYYQPSKVIKLKPGVSIKENDIAIEGPAIEKSNKSSYQEYQKMRDSNFMTKSQQQALQSKNMMSHSKKSSVSDPYRGNNNEAYRDSISSSNNHCKSGYQIDQQQRSSERILSKVQETYRSAKSISNMNKMQLSESYECSFIFDTQDGSRFMQTTGDGHGKQQKKSNKSFIVKGSVNIQDLISSAKEDLIELSYAQTDQNNLKQQQSLQHRTFRSSMSKYRPTKQSSYHQIRSYKNDLERKNEMNQIMERLLQQPQSSKNQLGKSEDIMNLTNFSNRSTSQSKRPLHITLSERKKISKIRIRQQQ